MNWFSIFGVQVFDFYQRLCDTNLVKQNQRLK